jgi:hypothetical protein
VIACLDDATFAVLLGNGAGGFAAPISFAVGNAPSDLALGDIDDDGAIDVLVTSQSDDLVAVYLSDP